MTAWMSELKCDACSLRYTFNSFSIPVTIERIECLRKAMAELFLLSVLFRFNHNCSQYFAIKKWSNHTRGQKWTLFNVDKTKQYAECLCWGTQLKSFRPSQRSSLENDSDVFYICLSVCRFVKGNVGLCRTSVRTHARTYARTHTHIHTTGLDEKALELIYIYIYVYIL